MSLLVRMDNGFVYRPRRGRYCLKKCVKSHLQVSTFLAYTPGGRGIAARDPFLPGSVQMRGKRIQGSISYKSDFFQRGLWKY